MYPRINLISFFKLRIQYKLYAVILIRRLPQTFDQVTRRLT